MNPRTRDLFIMSFGSWLFMGNAREVDHVVYFVRSKGCMSKITLEE
jgi:hypothetical protein